jgi:hypothetical protein
MRARTVCVALMMTLGGLLRLRRAKFSAVLRGSAPLNEWQKQRVEVCGAGNGDFGGSSTASREVKDFEHR